MHHSRDDCILPGYTSQQGNQYHNRVSQVGTFILTVNASVHRNLYHGREYTLEGNLHNSRLLHPRMEPAFCQEMYLSNGPCILASHTYQHVDLHPARECISVGKLSWRNTSQKAICIFPGNTSQQENLHPNMLYLPACGPASCHVMECISAG